MLIGYGKDMFYGYAAMDWLALTIALPKPVSAVEHKNNIDLELFEWKTVVVVSHHDLELEHAQDFKNSMNDHSSLAKELFYFIHHG